VAALDEIHRVLRLGGRASIFDMRKAAPRDAIDQEVRHMQLSPPSAVITRWIFRLGLLRAAYTRDALEAVVGRSRFGRGEIVPEGIGFELRLVR
jgi:ubiquinone/menaquinone biosynthesis C-methylase UbiE